jgi:hypothetical protein
MAKVERKSFRQRLLGSGRKGFQRAFGSDGLAGGRAGQAVAEMMENAAAWFTDSLGSFSRIANGYFETHSNTAKPPDGWSLSTGLWGTDASVNESSQLSGGRSVQLAATSTDIDIIGPITAIEPDVNHKIRARYKTATAGNDVEFGVYAYDSTKTLLSIVAAATPTTANTAWQDDTELVKSSALPANTVYIAPYFGTDGTATDTIDIDLIDMFPSPSARGFHATTFRVGDGVPQTITTATWTEVYFSHEEYDVGGTFHQAGIVSSDSYFTAPVDGYYRFTGHVTFTTSATGDVRMALYKSTGGAYSVTKWIQAINTHQLNLGFGGTTRILLDKGDTIKLYIRHERGSNAIISSGGKHNTWFEGHEDN